MVKKLIGKKAKVPTSDRTIVTRSLSKIIETVPLNQYNRARRAYVGLTRNAEFERLIILNRPIQRIPNRRPSLQERPVQYSTLNTPAIIKQRRQPNAADPAPVQTSRLTRRLSLSVDTRPSLNEFLIQFDRAQEQSNIDQVDQQNNAMRRTSRTSFFSRGRRASTSLSEQITANANTSAPGPSQISNYGGSAAIEMGTARTQSEFENASGSISSNDTNTAYDNQNRQFYYHQVQRASTLMDESDEEPPAKETRLVEATQQSSLVQSEQNVQHNEPVSTTTVAREIPTELAEVHQSNPANALEIEIGALEYPIDVKEEGGDDSLDHEFHSDESESNLDEELFLRSLFNDGHISDSDEVANGSSASTGIVTAGNEQSAERMAHQFENAFESISSNDTSSAYDNRNRQFHCEVQQNEGIEDIRPEDIFPVSPPPQSNYVFRPFPPEFNRRMRRPSADCFQMVEIKEEDLMELDHSNDNDDEKENRI